MITRYIGKCPVCEGDFKLNPDGRTMVHHGYRRPGHGSIVGDCYAVGREAYELSCDATRDYLGVVQGWIAGRRARLARLRAGEVTVLSEQRYGTRAPVDVCIVEVRFPALLDGEIRQTGYEIDGLEGEAKRLERLIDAWKLCPVRTVEELERNAQVSRAERQAEVAKRRQARVDAALASYRKRIDSAVRNHTASVIARIFEDCTSKLSSVTGRRLSHLDALALIERDHVWAAFGLVVDGAVGMNARDVTRAMEYPGYMQPPLKSYPWPATLRSEKKCSPLSIGDCTVQSHRA